MNTKILEIISSSWTKETCDYSLQDKWTIDNPSLGQSDVTSLIINDLFDGKIIKCNKEYYYNLIDGKVVDITNVNHQNQVLNEECTSDTLLSNKDIKKRYSILLKNVSTKLIVNTFDSITYDERIDRKYLDEICFFNTFEIDNYFNSEDYEIVQFDLAAQNTGNIFVYKYDKDTKKYTLMERPKTFSMKTSDYNIPVYILDQIFNVARDNNKNIQLSKKLQDLTKKY